MPTEKTYTFINEPWRILIKKGMVKSPGELFLSNNSYFNSEKYWSNTNQSVPDATIDVRHLLNEVNPTTDELNRLYEKIKEAVTGPKGELLTSAVEWKSSLGMVTSRITQISAAYSAVKKLQFSKASAILRLSPSVNRKIERQLRNKKIEFSPTSAWLEYWMGWAPLCGDITHALNTITGVPKQSNHFSVGVRLKRPQEVIAIGDEYDRIKWVTETIGKLSAYGNFHVTNHNMAVANQLGLLNPALVAWQIVPFSFIVDWFANIGNVVGSLTDFVGIEMRDTGYAKNVTVTSTGTRRTSIYDNMNSTYYVTVYKVSHGKAEGFGRVKRRSPGPIQAPRLEIKMLDKLSLTRALTSISLLTEIFLKK